MDFEQESKSRVLEYDKTVCHDQNGGMGYVRYIPYLLSNDLSYTSIFFLYLITPSNSERFFFRNNNLFG